ncbi:hypothetical protein [Micromonospora sp. NPDC005161]
MIYLCVPSELASELVTSGAARQRPKPRGSIVELIVTGATGAATFVSLLQGPETVLRIARAFRAVALKRPDKRIEVHIKGPKGEVHLFDCDGDTPLEELAALVKRDLLG